MKAQLTITKTKDMLANLRKAVAALTEQDVFIGVPAETDGRNGEMNNAYLSYIHEHGVPENNLPARPFLIPGIQAVQNEAAEILEEAAKEALEGKESAVGRSLNRIGQLAVNSVNEQFVDNDWEPLKEATLTYKPLKKDDEGKVITTKKGKSHRQRSREERGRTNPLIDTGQLRDSQTYVVRKKTNTGLIVK